MVMRNSNALFRMQSTNGIPVDFGGRRGRRYPIAKALPQICLFDLPGNISVSVITGTPVT